MRFVLGVYVLLVLLGGVNVVLSQRNTYTEREREVCKDASTDPVYCLMFVTSIIVAHKMREVKTCFSLFLY